MSERELFRQVAEHAADFVDTLDTRPIRAAGDLRGDAPGASADRSRRSRSTRPRSSTRWPGPRSPDSPACSRAGTSASSSAATLPAALAADWLASAWDQNAGLVAVTPAAVAVEEVAGGWLLDLLGLPAEPAVALRHRRPAWRNFDRLAAARHAVLARGRLGCRGARPPGRAAAARRAVAREAARDASTRALRFLGLGEHGARPRRHRRPGPDAADDLRRRARPRAPAPDDRVRWQAGNVNTGAFDPFAERRRAGARARRVGARRRRVRAVGRRSARARAPRRAARARRLVGHRRAQVAERARTTAGSRSCAHPAAHRAAMACARRRTCSTSSQGQRDPFDWTPEFSRRARGCRGLGRAALARPHGRRRSRRALLRARAPFRRGARGRRARDPQRRRAQPGARRFGRRRRDAARSSPRCRRTAPAGSAAPTGRGARDAHFGLELAHD